jgi:hypothetical protein
MHNSSRLLFMYLISIYRTDDEQASLSVVARRRLAARPVKTEG